jgi:hypothetical protein
MTSSPFPFLLQYLIASGPTLLVATVGVLLTIINWGKLGRAGIYAVCGFGLHLFTSLAYLVASLFMQAQVSSGSSSGVAMGYRVIGAVNGTLHALALACLLAALLAPRGATE